MLHASRPTPTHIHRWTRAGAAATWAVLLATSACKDTLGEPPVATLIEIAPNRALIDIGTSVTLTASVLDINGHLITSGEPVTWASGTPAVATIDASGRVTGVAPGDTKISARRGGVLGSALVTVKLPIPARVEIPAPSVALSRGDTARLSARALSAAGAQYAGRAFAWSSSDAAIVQVVPSSDSSSARVTAVAPGTATITASNLGVTGSVTITINADAIIDVNPVSVAFVGTFGGADPAPQVVAITNAGGGTLRGISVSSIQFAPGQPTGWLQSAIGGPGTAPVLTLAASPRGLAIGNYAATVTLASTAPAVLPRALNVTFAVAPPPRLTLATASVTFGAAAGGDAPAPQSVAITNSGGGTLTGLAVSVPTTPAGQPAPWLGASLASTTGPTQLTFTVNPTGLALGTYSATVSVSASGAVDSPKSVSVTLTVSQNALIVAAPGTVPLSAVAGSSPAPTSVSITNGGAVALTGLSVGAPAYGANQPTGWLAASLNTTQAPATLTLTSSSNALVPGSYTATVQVRSSLTGVSPVTVTVNLTVRTAAVIVATTQNLTITATGATSNPTANVGITNGGSGTLDALRATVTYGSGQPGGWLTTTFAGGNTTAPTTLTLQPRGTLLDVGTYTATVRLDSPNAPVPVDIAVTFNVSGSLQPADFLVQLFSPQGDGVSATASNTVRNAGVGIISGLTATVSYVSGSGWLATALTAGSTPSTLLVQAKADATSTRGLYEANVTLSGRNVAPVSVAVTRYLYYSFERHIVTPPGVTPAVNTFATLGCTNGGCHDAGNFNNRHIANDFTSYDDWLNSGYITGGGSAAIYSEMLNNFNHQGGPPFPFTPANPNVARIRDWLIDGSRRR